MSPETLQQQVIQSLNRSEVAFNEGRPAYFDEFGAEAMIFTVDSPDPIKGRDAYRQAYESALTGSTRQKMVLDRDVQIVGDKAVVTQTARLQHGDGTIDVRQTIVYGETTEGVKVLHSHTTLLRPSNADESALPPIQVVNEKIAPVSSSLGVAQ
jgi:ketosteroid isomerase-like protein